MAVASSADERRDPTTPGRPAGFPRESLPASPTPSTTRRSFATSGDDDRRLVLRGALGAPLLEDELLPRLVEDALVPLDDGGCLGDRFDRLNQVEVRFVDQPPRNDVAAE